MDKKELTTQQIQQRKKLIVYPLMILLFLGVMWLIFAPDNEDSESPVIGFNTEIPVSKKDQILGDKKTAFEREQFRKNEEEKMKTLRSFDFSLTDEAKENIDTIDLKIGSEDILTENKKKSGGSSLNHSAATYQNMNQELQDFYKTAAKDPEKEALKARIEELSKKIENETKEDPVNRQLELIEKSYQLASRYWGNSSASQTQQVPVVSATPNDGNTGISPVSLVSESVVSSLEQPIPDTTFIKEYLQPRNYSFTTAVGSNKLIDRNTIKACIYSDQILMFGEKNEAQYVNFRLLEAVCIGNSIIPPNSILSGIAQLQGTRLNITVENIHYAGKIYPVKLTVFDTDGQEGIYAPSSTERNAMKEAGASIGGSLGNSVSFTHSAGQQVAMDLSRGLMQAGSQYLSSKIKTAKVRLKANYNVLLMISKN